MNTRDLARTGVLTAIVFVTMSLLHVTIFGSELHLGSLVIVVISLSFDRKQAVLASGIGAMLFDVFAGYLNYAFFTLIARLLLSLIVSYAKDRSIPTQVIHAILGGLMVIAIYFVSYLILIEGISESMAATIPDFIQLILTVLGVFVAIPVRKIVKKLG